MLKKHKCILLALLFPRLDEDSLLGKELLESIKRNLKF